MKYLMEEANQLNEGGPANRPGYRKISNCCAECANYDEPDRYNGDLPKCTIYGKTAPYSKESSEWVEAHGICNLFKRW